MRNNKLFRLVLLLIVFGLPLSPFQPSLYASESLAPTAANATVCVNFTNLAPGSSVEGYGTVYSELNISTSGNAVVVDEGFDPTAYTAPNGDNKVVNGGVGTLNGFSDIEKFHDYVFTFSPGTTVDYFTVNMLDFGDFNPELATEHEVTMVAYNTEDEIVSTDALSFTSDGQRVPRGGSAGDLYLTGDAATAKEGEPGNYIFEVSGAGIARVEMQYSSNLGPIPTDPNIALAVLCFEPETSTPATGTFCANFSQLPPGVSVEGLGTINPDLNITTSGNAVVVDEGFDPITFTAPNGDNKVVNGGVGTLDGFSDIEKFHDYVFTFSPGTTVDYFTVNMLDFGDFNPELATEHEVTMVAYNTEDEIVSTDALSFTSDGQRVPRGGSAGDLYLTGDAATAKEGEPGNYIFEVSGAGIARVEMQYSSNLGPIPTDPNIALAVLCFEPDSDSIQELDPPTAELTMLRPKTTEVGGKFLVEYACSETAPNLVSADINGYDVTSGQEVNLVVRDHQSARIVDGTLIWLFAPEFSLNVTCADDLGNQVSTSVQPEFVFP